MSVSRSIFARVDDNDRTYFGRDTRDRDHIGYIDARIVILDIADKAHPKLISRLDYHPPYPGFTHTVLPLFERELLVVTDEATGDEGVDWPKRCWIVDARAETNPVIISSLPTPQDFARLVGAPGIGGYYERDRKRLVSQDIGPSLRHEFFHVLHWRRMDRTGQQHPYWVMEGFATLVEDIEADGSGGISVVPSWRTNIVRRLERAGRRRRR